MQKRLTWMLVILLALVAIAGCSDDDDNPLVPQKSAFQTMAEAGTAYINDSTPLTGCPGIISAAALEASLDQYTVIDIRAESAYLAGHIPGAYHSSLGTLLDDLSSKSIPTGKPYVIACYSGQSAGHAKIAMEMLGYEVYSLLFGMSSWSAATRGPWDNATVNADMADRNLLTNPETDNNNDQLTAGDLPVLTESASTVVADRVEAMLDAGFKGISYATYLANPDDYFVVNYFGEADYLGDPTSGTPGHIPGAFQFTPYASLGWGENLDKLPLDKVIVVYCWTGQHSSQITAYLNMLGYTAVSLTYGSNKLFYDSLNAHKWTSAAYNDFALETGSVPTPAFAAVAAKGLEYISDSTALTGCPGVISAAALEPQLDNFTVIDIRAGEDYDAGHIPGAYNSSLGTILTDLTDGTIPTGKPYVIACYSGQSAGHVKLAMEMLDYEVYSLLFGMSSWSADTRSPWDNATVNADMADRNLLTNPETTANAIDGYYAFPEMAGDASGAIETAVAGMLSGGFKGISYATYALNPENYYVINYFGEADYLGDPTSGTPGHIPGAFQYTPYTSLGWDEMLASVPTDMPVIVYCWTGQHSSQITAYLNMLGYDAYSLTYGSNKLFYDSLNSHKWTAAAYNDFQLEVTPLQ